MFNTGVPIDQKSLCQIEVHNEGENAREDVEVTLGLPQGCLVGGLRLTPANGAEVASNYLQTDSLERTNIAIATIKRLPPNSHVTIALWLARGSRSRNKRTFEIGAETNLSTSEEIQTFKVERLPGKLIDPTGSTKPVIIKDTLTLTIEDDAFSFNLKHGRHIKNLKPEEVEAYLEEHPDVIHQIKYKDNTLFVQPETSKSLLDRETNKLKQKELEILIPIIERKQEVAPIEGRMEVDSSRQTRGER